MSNEAHADNREYGHAGVRRLHQLEAGQGAGVAAALNHNNDVRSRPAAKKHLKTRKDSLGGWELQCIYTKSVGLSGNKSAMPGSHLTQKRWLSQQFFASAPHFTFSSYLGNSARRVSQKPSPTLCEAHSPRAGFPIPPLTEFEQGRLDGWHPLLM